MKTNLKKTVLSIVMAGTMAITCMLPATAESTAQAESNKIQYDKKTIKKVYKLLANMKLEKKEPDGKIRYGFVYVTLQTKKGKKLTYFFQNGEVHINSKQYTVVENNPLDGIRKIYKSIKR